MSIATAYSSLSFLSPSTTLFSPHHHYHHHTSLLHLPLRRKPFTVTATTTSLSPLTPVPIPIPILDFDGNITGETFLTLKTAPPSTARAVVHRAIITDQRNARRGTASTLTRAEVRGGGKKPYRQKKTGRARRGSQTTPLRRGGGVIFGPKPKDWSIKINRKEKKLAMGTAIASAVGTGVLVVEEFSERFERPRTKEFVAAMRRWGIEPAKEKAMFMMMEVEENVVRSGRNVGTVRMVTPRGLNLFDVLNSDKLVFTRGAVEYLNATYGVIDYDADEDEDEEDDDGEDEEGSEEGESSEVVE